MYGSILRHWADMLFIDYSRIVAGTVIEKDSTNWSHGELLISHQIYVVRMV